MARFLLLFLAGAANAAAPVFLPAMHDRLQAEKSLFEQRRYADVVARLTPEQMQKLPNDDLKRAYLYLAASYERLGSLDKALGVSQLGVSLFPRDINLLTEQGDLLHRAGLEEQAEPLFQKVLEIHPNNAAAHLGLAEIDHSLGFLDRSAEHYEKALEAMPDNAPAWRDYAEVLSAKRDYKTAELAVRRALAIAPDVESSVDLAMIQRASGRLGEALATVQAASAGAPERRDVTLLRGLWLLEDGLWSDALAAAQAVLTGNPNDPLARWIRARVRLKQDRYADAVADLRAAASQDKAPFVSQAARTLLDALSARP